jgi:hypothetical protein
VQEKEKLRDQIEKVETYLEEKRNIFVIFDRKLGNFYCGETITINTCQNLEYQLHTLLHEAGHALIRADKKKFQQRYPGLQKRKNSKSYKLDTLKEEIEAWDRGYRLANRLSIPLNEYTWRKHSENCLHDYVKWVVNG